MRMLPLRNGIDTAFHFRYSLDKSWKLPDIIIIFSKSSLEILLFVVAGLQFTIQYPNYLRYIHEKKILIVRFPA
jgi:hypothetical protein